MRTVFVSDAIHRERLIFDTRPGGGARRVWHDLSALYRASLQACRYRVTPVVRPEVYQSGWAKALLGVAPGDWHLAVKPIEHLRPFHGVPNIFVCDWPFPELSGVLLGGSPFFDQRRLLGVADVVACCTDATADVLRRAGVARVMTLPPHIPARPGRQGAPGKGLRFLSVIDAHLPLRTLGPSIAGFAQAQARRGGLRWTIRVQGDDGSVVADLSRQVALHGLDPADILVAEDDPACLPDADFFLCGSVASGLHVPMVQAMLAGMPLVTTRGAGLASLAPTDAAVVIPTSAEPWTRDDEPIGRFMSLTSEAPTPADLCDAILAAAELGDAARGRMGRAGQAQAARQFGLPAFEAGLARLDALLSSAA